MRKKDHVMIFIVIGIVILVGLGVAWEALEIEDSGNTETLEQELHRDVGQAAQTIGTSSAAGTATSTATSTSGDSSSSAAPRSRFRFATST